MSTAITAAGEINRGTVYSTLLMAWVESLVTSLRLKEEVDRVDLHASESYRTHTYLAACLVEQHMCRI